jgi:hypothetical protein
MNFFTYLLSMKKPLQLRNVHRSFLLGSFLSCQLLAVPTAIAQLAPPGYTGAINTPTADVIGYGHLVGSMSTTIPERKRVYPGVGWFGGTNLGFGLAPGLEAVGRLTYDGDAWCDQYDSSCKTTTRDLSFGGKYQLPLGELPLKSRLAFGMTDYGGAATLYRQYYGVATANLGPLEISAGAATSTQGGLMHGKFGSLSIPLVDNLRLIAESDTREKRVGLAYRLQALPDLQVAFGSSRKLTNNSYQQRNQMTISLAYAMDGAAIRNGQLAANTSTPIEGTKTFYASNISSASNTSAAPLIEVDDSEQAATFANSFAAQLERAGFSEISVGREGRLWHVRAEPRAWRKNRLDALGVVMAQWQRNSPFSDTPVAVTLTFLKNPVLQARTSQACLDYFVKGIGVCTEGRPFVFKDDPISMQTDLDNVNWLSANVASQFLRPDVELSPSASYTVGSEFGIYDYSAGISTGVEVPLYKGLFYQGHHTRLVTETEDFKDPNHYFRRVGLGERTARGASMFTYMRPVYKNLWVEASQGALSSSTKGTTLNSVWTSSNSKLKISATKGSYKQSMPYGFESLNPSFVTARYAIRPGFWALSVTKGRFLNNDEGYQLMSSHTFGDNRVRFFYRKTGPGNFQTPNKRAFAGFSVTLPIGPRESFAIGPLTLRGRDQYPLGLETKVQEKDNYIEPGYGLYPSLRHGLNTDVGDYDRGDIGSIQTNLHRLIASIREHAKN